MAWLYFDLTTVILALCVIWITAIIQRLYIFKTFKRLGIPGPKPHFIFGNFHEIQKTKNPMDVISQWFEKYGNIVGYYQGCRPVLLVKDPEMIKLILIKYFKKFINRPSFNNIPPPPIQQSLFNLQGDNWKHVRNALTPAFTAKKLKQISGMMNNAVDIMLELINDKAKLKEEFDAFKLYKSLTMHIIGESIFALNVNCQRDPNDKFVVAANKLFKGNNAFLVYLAICFPSVGPVLFKIIQKLLLFGFQAKSNYLSNSLRDIIDFRRQEKKEIPIDVLQLMLQATKLNSNDEFETSKLSSEIKFEKVKLNSDEIIANSMAFLLGGFQSTANALSITTYLLAKHPNIQKKIQDEIDLILGKKDIPDYETVQNFERLDEAICESLRMYPPVPLVVSRECVEDCDINGIIIPKGMKVTIPIWQIHHDSSIWPDPYEFRPDRFSSENKSERTSLTWLPFGDGPRNCIGMRFALFEIKIAMARLLRNFTFIPGENFEDELQLRHFPPLMSIKNGIFIKAVPREY